MDAKHMKSYVSRIKGSTTALSGAVQSEDLALIKMSLGTVLNEASRLMKAIDDYTR